MTTVGFSSLTEQKKSMPNRALFFTQGREVKITANDLPFFTHGNFRKGFFLFLLQFCGIKKLVNFKPPLK
jgi:hypothetical protein